MWIVKMWHKIVFSFKIRRCLWIDKLTTRPTKVHPKTLLVVRTDAIGDYLLFRNFLEILRQSSRFKDYQITLCGNQVWQDLAMTYDVDFFDEFIPIDRKLFFENPIYRYKTQKKINEKGFETAINPTFSDELLYGHSIIRVSNALEKIGSIGDSDNLVSSDKKIADSFYSQQLNATSKILFEFDRNKEFFENLLGKKIKLNRPQLSDYQKFNSDLEPKKYMVLFSGASTKERCWSATNFREIAQQIHEKWQLKIVLAGGKANLIYAEQIIKNNSIPFINLVGETALPELVTLIQNGVFLLTNETSAIHIGASTQTPSLCVSNNAWHYGRFNPYPQKMQLPIQYIFPPQLDGLKADEIRQQFPKRGILDINDIEWQTVWQKMEALYQAV